MLPSRLHIANQGGQVCTNHSSYIQTQFTPPSSHHWPLSTYFYICYIPTHTCSYLGKARWNEEASNYTGQITFLIHPQLRHNKFPNGWYIVGAGSQNPKFNSNKSQVEQLGRRGWISPHHSPTPKLEGSSIGPPYVASKVHGLHRAHILINFELGPKLLLQLKFKIEISLKIQYLILIEFSMTKITKGKHDLGNQNVTKQKKKIIFLNEQTYLWVVPIRMSHPKFMKPIQLQNDIGLI